MYSDKFRKTGSTKMNGVHVGMFFNVEISELFFTC